LWHIAAPRAADMERGAALCHLPVIQFHHSGNMEMDDALSALSALAQPTRLQAFRLLVRAAPHGMASGALARALDVPANTLSSHLSVLTKAALVRSSRQGRSITYRAELDRLRAAIAYLLKDCCAAEPAICAPLVADIQQCCPPARCLS